jgi:hypothetical protein
VARFETLWIRSRGLAAAYLLASSLPAAPALAGEGDAGGRIGGHIGVAVPIVTWIDDGDGTEVSDVSEDTVVAVPMGITIHRAAGPLAFDMELVPAVTEDDDVSVTIHPGLVLPLERVALGLRAAFDTENDALGFTPLVAVPFSIGELNLFVELDAPVRFPDGPVDATYAIATHLGIAF